MRLSPIRTGLIILSCALGIFLCVFAQIGSRVVTLRAAAAAAQIIIDPANPAATEVTVNEGNTVQLKPQVRDSAGNAVDNAPLAFSSVDPSVATVDSLGLIQGRKAGFSTLTVASGTLAATATITVVSIASSATPYKVTGVAQDLARRFYMADTPEHTILLTEDLQGFFNIYAGRNQVPGFADDKRLNALFERPAFLAFDQASGDLYVSDSTNNAIRRIRPAAVDKVETLAGSGQPGSDDGSVTVATFKNPQGIALDNRGFLWVVDSGNHVIRRIDLLNKTVKTIAGLAGIASFGDGVGAAARFNSPTGITVESETVSQQQERKPVGTLPSPVSVIISDTGNGVIRRVKETGEVETITVTSQSKLVTGANGEPLLKNPQATTTPTFNSPTGVAVDPLGNIFVSETGANQVKVILKNGATTLAARAGPSSSPRGIAINNNGRVVVAGDSPSLQQLTYGQPLIATIAPSRIGNRGGTIITIKGGNFSPETLVLVAGIVPTFQVVDTQTIIITPPALPSGRSPLTVQNRGGLAQTEVQIDPVPLNELPAGQITTVAGGSTLFGDGTLAQSAFLRQPSAIAVDGNGNFYIADQFNHRIRKVDPRTGIIVTVAGAGQLGFDGDNGSATVASLNSPQGVAVDLFGNLYIADTGNHRVRKVDARRGIITTLAGNGQRGFSGDDGLGSNAALNSPQAVAVDFLGNVYIADTGNHRIRKVEGSTGIITTAAGTGQAGFSGNGGQGPEAALNFPAGVAVDFLGNLYIADSANNRVRKVSGQTGIITNVAGSSEEAGFFGDAGPAVEASLSTPLGVAADSAGNFYIADTGNNRIRKVEVLTGTINTVAGSGQRAFSGDNGPATMAALAFVQSLTIDAAGDLYIADRDNNRVRRVDARTGSIATVAGIGLLDSGDNGPATAAVLTIPLGQGLAVDFSGNIFFSDTQNNRIRKVDARTGIISTAVGTGEAGFSGDSVTPTTATLNSPQGLAFDSQGNLYIVDTLNHRIRKVDFRTGIITTVAGNGRRDFAGDNGPAAAAALSSPVGGIAIDTSGNVYFADTDNQRIRRVDSRTGVITTVAGTGFSDFSGDNGPATAAALRRPRGLVVDPAGNLFIADTENHRIRKVDFRTGVISTIAGTGQRGSSGDGGPAVAALLNFPRGLTLDSTGNLYIADSSNHRIRKVNAQTGVITTVAGNGQAAFSGDNGPATGAALLSPLALGIDPSGNLIVEDSGNGRIRAIRGPLEPVIPTVPSRRRP
ncbi:MAG TPA: IPT/TIG domain-containing protein [Acidobacteriota bacterium]|jgi:sugar lactone lactonase YvrE|nr:IPT/TIG domain-containing protein [Acidobacteriota bacterium]